MSHRPAYRIVAMTRARVGYRIAQAGAILHMIGGATDLSTRRLMPFQEEFLGVAAGGAPHPVATLVLALLHAVGSGLIAGGVAMLILLHRMRTRFEPGLAWAIAFIALACEGMVGTQMLRLHFVFGAIPLVIAALVLIGVALCVWPTFGFTFGASPQPPA